jgi:hypothetical protein
MGWLRDRVNNKEAHAAEVAQHEALVEGFEKQAPRLLWMDERDEAMLVDGRQNKHHLVAEKFGVMRLYGLYQRVERDVYGTCDYSWQPRVTNYFDRVIETEKSKVPLGVSRQQWDREKHKDVIENFLYNEYVDQLDGRDPIRTFPAYAMFVCAKAVIALLTTHKAGEEALRRLHPKDQPLPLREKAIAFKEQIDYDVNDPDWFMAHVFVEVPGTWEAIQTLQLHYGDIVRAEHETVEEAGVLPDDPIGATLETRYKTPEELRIEAAITAFEAGEGSGDNLAKVYSVPRDKLRLALRERGLAKRGGDRLAKKEN